MQKMSVLQLCQSFARFGLEMDAILIAGLATILKANLARYR